MNRLKSRSIKAIVLAGCAVAGLGAVTAPAAWAQGAPSVRAAARSYDIPAQDLGSALNQFAQQSETQISFRADLTRGKRAPAVRGVLTPSDALTRLLRGAGLSWRTLPSGAILVSGAAGNGPEAGSDAMQSADEPSSVEEVIVTAQKREERLIDVPAPVSVIDAQKLAMTNQLRLEDYYRLVPGLSLGLAGEAGQASVSIRGLTTSGDANPTVGIVVDEISYGATVAAGTGLGVAAPDLDPGDVARIEVLRGPQGTLYGASSLGGLLKYVTIDPSTAGFSGRLQAGVSSVAHGDGIGRTFRGMVNVPVGDTLAVRVSAFDLTEPGYVDNAKTGEEDVNTRENRGVRAAVLWRPSDDFSLRLNAMQQRFERMGPSEVDTALPGGGYRQSYLPGTGDFERESRAYSATVNARLGPIDVVSATGFTLDESAYDTDITPVIGFIGDLLAGIPRVYSHSDIRVEKFTQEVRGTMPIGDRVDLLAGAFYTQEHVEFFGENVVANVDGSRAGSIFQLRYGPNDFEELAAFGAVTFKLTDQFDIQFGGRLSRNKQSGGIVWTGAQAQFFFGQDPYIVATKPSEDSSFTYLITPRYRFNEDVMIYARLASGYRPGGFNNGCGHPQIPCNFEPDTTRNYEVGLKGAFLDGKLTVDGSLFYIDWNNIQIQNLITTVAPFFAFTANVSKARSSGLELAVEARPVQGLTLSAWVAYLDAQLRAGFPPQQAVFLAGSPGDRLPYSARWSGALSADWEHSIGDDLVLMAGGSLSLVGERQGGFEAISTPRASFPAYAQLDLRIGVRRDSWTLSAYANNVADTRGVLRGGGDSQFFGSYYTYIQPRTIGATLSKSF